MPSYRDLEVWRLAREVSVDIHTMTLDHLDTLYETGSLKDQRLYQNLAGKLDKLGRKLSRFIAGVEREPISPR